MKRQAAQLLFTSLFFVMLTGCSTLSPTPTTTTNGTSDPVLQQKLEGLVEGFHGDVGIYVRHLRTGRTATVRAEELFPTASMIKVPIMLGMFDKMSRGELDYHGDLVYDDSLLYEGEDILGAFKDSAKISLSKVIMLMITTSDNTASLWCQAMAGGGETINALLSQYGFDSTRVNSRTPGRRPNWERYGWGQTTPREMAELLVMIREGKAVSSDASEEMYRILCRIFWDGEALSQIPPFVQAASKQGAVNRSRSEVVLVNAPSGDYVFCIITKNLEDQSWKKENEGYVLIRNLSRLLWQYFEPQSDWSPAPGIQKWW